MKTKFYKIPVPLSEVYRGFLRYELCYETKPFLSHIVVHSISIKRVSMEQLLDLIQENKNCNVIKRVKKEIQRRLAKL